jgi:GMP synthase-like glutamine amidotransferase/SAM-dependent methyltransferase
MPPRLLVFQHCATAPQGLLGERFLARGAQVTLLDAEEGCAIPPDAADHDGLVLLGGVMSAYDDARCPHFPALLELVRAYGRRGRPVLGICLGAQLVARALGANVRLGASPEFGFVDLVALPDASADPLARLAGPGLPVMAWHDDGFDLPLGAVPLMTCVRGRNHTFRWGKSVYGFQTHIEADLETIKLWGRTRGQEKNNPAVGVRLSAEILRHYERSSRFGRGVADAWLDLVEAARTPAGLGRAAPALAVSDVMPVIRYYETHPINEDQILSALRGRGIGLEGLSETDLSQHDQDHFGGLEATDLLADLAGIGAGTRVLDVCSGLGGPARYLASRRGCRVVGLDLTASRHAAAIRLTRMTGLDHLVAFQQGDAQAMPFEDAGFEVVMGQEAWAHVPDKTRLVAEAVRVVQQGGRIAFTDIMARDSLPPEARERLRHEMTFLSLETLEGYARLLEANGCTVIVKEDLGEPWTAILRRRLAMYRSLEATTVEKFGRERFLEWDRIYSFFVSLFGLGQLTGGRIVARRDR